jgi:DNA-binding MarR family transcriptional regulator
MSQQNAAPPPTSLFGSARLYLREDELDIGVANILDAASAIKRATEAKRHELGLSWADGRVLSACGRSPQPVLSLARRLAVTKQALAKTLDGLEKQGLILRDTDPRDARKRIVRLTPAGTRIEHELGALARTKLAAAYRMAGGDAVAGSDSVLRALLGQKS